MHPQSSSSRYKAHGDGSDGEQDRKGHGRQNPVDGSVVSGRVDIEANTTSEASARGAEPAVVPRAGTGSFRRAIFGRRAMELRLYSRQGGYRYEEKPCQQKPRARGARGYRGKLPSHIMAASFMSG